MRRVLTTVLAVVLLLGLGALAVLASPNADASLAGAPAVSASAPEFQEAPLAPTAQNFNQIAMPLNAASQFTKAGYTFTASGLASLVGSGVRQVSAWEPVDQLYLSWTIDPELGGSGTDFNLVVGGAYWLLLDTGGPDIVSFVGDIPAQQAVRFNFQTGTPCKFNEFSIPLDQGAVKQASQLATLLGAAQVSQWNATTHVFESWTVDSVLGGSGTDFVTKIGYPVTACLPTGAPTIWP